MHAFQKIGILGGGAWGTALAISLARAGRDVLLWAREPEVVSGINESGENALFLPGHPLPPSIEATADLARLAETSLWFFVVPVQHMRAVALDLAALFPKPKRGEAAQPIVLCSKGIEIKTLDFPLAIARAALPGHKLAVLSGPTFAAEVAAGQPTAVTLACAEEEQGRAIMRAIATPTFRPYYSNDLEGAEIGGAIKNVLALATGIATGLGMGDNARAALITRGLAEMMRLGHAMGGKRETLMGLSGLGDLTLTCSSPQSRNMSLGIELGRGKTLAEIMATRRSVAEGVPTSAAAHKLARKLKVEMPITAAVDAVLNKGASLPDTLRTLLSRPLKPEQG